MYLFQVITVDNTITTVEIKSVVGHETIVKPPFMIEVGEISVLLIPRFQFVERILVC